MKINGVVQFVEQTFQGESFEPGHPATLLRFKKCLVGCPWCDTMKESAKLVEFDVELNKLLQAVRKTHYLLVTGGEPFLYVEELTKLALLFSASYSLPLHRVQHPPEPELMFEPGFEPNPRFPFKLVVETTLFNPDIDASFIEGLIRQLTSATGGNTKFTISPKLKTIEKLASLYERLVMFPQVRFKFVLAGSKEEKVEILAFLTKLVEKVPTFVRPTKFALMPLGSTPEELNMNAEEVLSICKDLQISFSPRLQITHNFP